MNNETVTRQILRASSKARKSYTFDDDHDATVPVEIWVTVHREEERMNHKDTKTPRKPQERNHLVVRSMLDNSMRPPSSGPARACVSIRKYH